MRNWLRIAVVATLLVALPIVASLGHVLWASWGKVYDVETVPESTTAMVLGAKVFPAGPSAFLAARLDVAVALHDAGKVQDFIVSGDGSAASNDEPAAMKAYLVDHGVPAEAITEDPGGLDTYDSCVRARDEYGRDALIVVSQDFHVRRAITICEAVGVEALAVADSEATRRYPLNWVSGSARELLANVKMEWDLLTEREPPYEES